MGAIVKLIRLYCNTSPIDEMCDLFTRRFPDLFGEDFSELILEFDFGNFVTTLGADEIDDVVFTPKFGSRFENLMAALRAGNRTGVVHALDNLRSRLPKTIVSAA
jgi:hypothetical protein